jgi:hypothetical protein
VCAAEKQGTKDQYKIRKGYLDATDCGDRKTFGKEIKFTGELEKTVLQKYLLILCWVYNCYPFAFKV